MTGRSEAPTQAETLAYLCSPNAHGGETPQRIDTHLSHVVLTADYVLKLKRAIALDFVDYGSAEKRRLYCEREIAANAGWAEDLYLGVEPIWCIGGQFGCSEQPDGADIVDWVVRMRRVEDTERGDHLLAAGQLDRVCLEAFADDLAVRHAKTEASRDRGGAGSLKALIDQIGGDITRAAGSKEIGTRVKNWTAQAVAALESHAALADQRRSEGRVKPCHGDLHLKNLVRWKGRLIGFDALEFDPALTHIDTLYDAAFPIMDLMRRGRSDLANAFMNRFLAISDDYGGLPLLPLFLSLRAGVRALAAAMADEKAEADTYLELAASILADAEPARMIAIGGRSGTGKSTLARTLAPKIGHPPGAVVLRSDILRKWLAGVAPETRLPSDSYLPQQRHSLYDALCDRAKTVFATGRSCILDATFLDEDSRGALEAVESSIGVMVSKIWLDAPSDVLRDRVAGRGGDASDADVSVLERQLEHPTPGEDWRHVDVSGSPDAALANLARALEVT